MSKTKKNHKYPKKTENIGVFPFGGAPPEKGRALGGRAPDWKPCLELANRNFLILMIFLKAVFFLADIIPKLKLTRHFELWLKILKIHLKCFQTVDQFHSEPRA